MSVRRSIGRLAALFRWASWPPRAVLMTGQASCMGSSMNPPDALACVHGAIVEYTFAGIPVE